jgi:hypothetical protein
MESRTRSVGANPMATSERDSAKAFFHTESELQALDAEPNATTRLPSTRESCDASANVARAGHEAPASTVLRNGPSSPLDSEASGAEHDDDVTTAEVSRWTVTISSPGEPADPALATAAATRLAVAERRADSGRPEPRLRLEDASRRIR